jgi:hypothetical protein
VVVVAFGGGSVRSRFEETLVGEFRENTVRIAHLPSALGVSDVGYPHTGGLLERVVGVIAVTEGDDRGLEFRRVLREILNTFHS